MTATSSRILRRQYRHARRALTHAEQQRHAEQVARTVTTTRELFSARICGVYFTADADGEVDTLPLLSRLWSMMRVVACPVIAGSGEMDFYRVTPGTRLIANRFGIPEPATRGPHSGRYLNPRTLSVLFMPLVAFDESGGRLGMGAGYYDRYVGRLHQLQRPLLVGLAHEVQRTPELLPRNPWDVPLDAVITETGWQPFSTRAKVSRPN